MEQNPNKSSRLLTQAGGLMFLSGALMLLCRRWGVGIVFWAAAGCMLIAAYSVRMAENKNKEEERVNDDKETV